MKLIMAILPDVLAPNLKVVFCGTAVSKDSAQRNAYYADPNNLFWNILYETGLTPECLFPEDYNRLLQFGIGLTDLVKELAGNDNELKSDNFDISGFRDIIWQYQPKVIAFNGLKAAEKFYGRELKYGQQTNSTGISEIFVLPSTSGTARAFWEPMYWWQLAEYIRTKVEV